MMRQRQTHGSGAGERLPGDDTGPEQADDMAVLLASLEAALAGSAHDAIPRREQRLEEDGEGVLAQILAPHLAQEEQELATEQQRFAAYLADLRLLVREPGGAGLRVLRHWLDASCAFARLHGPAPQIYATTALADFARDRMAEIALADPAGHLRMQLIGARQWTQGMRLPGK